MSSLAMLSRDGKMQPVLDSSHFVCPGLGSDAGLLVDPYKYKKPQDRLHNEPAVSL
jgi:hypothetical protein